MYKCGSFHPNMHTQSANPNIHFQDHHANEYTNHNKPKPKLNIHMYSPANTSNKIATISAAHGMGKSFTNRKLMVAAVT